MTETQNANSAAEFHGYSFSRLVATYLFMPLLALASILMGVLIMTAAEPLMRSFLILFGACFLFLSAFGSLMCSSIAISDDGIAAHNFGRMLKFIRWEDVTKIKKVRRWNAGSRSYYDVFYVFNQDFTPLRERMVNLRGPIAFSNTISGVRNLVDKINESAQRHHFPLITLDQEAAARAQGKPWAAVETQVARL